jgi:cation transport ATPase
MKQKFEVTGMSCAACSASVERSVRKLNGVSDVNVSLLTNSMQVEYDPDATGPDAIISAVTGAGYGASCPAAAPRPQEGHEKAADKAVEEARRMKTRLIVSIIFWIPLMYIAMFHMLPAPAFMHAAFGGREWRCSVRFRPVPPSAAHNICKPQLLCARFSFAAQTRAQYGLAYRARFVGCRHIRSGGHIPHRLRARCGKYRRRGRLYRRRLF